VRQERFEGRIGTTVADSEPWFDDGPHPDDGAPDVVVVLLDDTGFAQLGCYGSDIDTPAIDALARDGVALTDFHVTPLCSPTRAALLTGRAPHAVGMRAVSNFRTGFPNQLGHISNHAATMAEVLGDAGYATFCVGKWHLAPMEQCSAAGPFDQWPLARGFDRFYGFLEGETDQFHPELVADNHHIDPPGTPEDGYHLSEDLVDQALRMIADSVGVRPDRPFFTYLAFGATHAPHQAPPAHLAKYRGRYDEGWDVVRERWYQRQLELGVIPPHTTLAPRNPGVEAWADLPESDRRLAARLQEAFAAFLDHTDVQIGRFVDGLARLGRLENTILVVLADNGASQEGGPHGVLHEMKFFNGILEAPEEAIAHLDDIGGPRSHANYPWGWAQCGNTPFRWYKQNTHEGGVHVPLIVHWPAGIPAEQRGTRRDRFAHVSDVAPTIYELVGVEPPTTRAGLEQLPVTGRSFATVLADPEAPAANRVQLFEQNGSRALIADGWKAVCKHVAGADYATEALGALRPGCRPLRVPRPRVGRARAAAAAGPALVGGGGAPRGAPARRPPGRALRAPVPGALPAPGDRRYVYRPPMSPLPAQAGPAIGGRSFDLDAHVRLGPGDHGVLLATGTENAGLSLFVQDGRLVLDYNAFGEHVVVESGIPVPAGEVVLGLRVRRLDGFAGSAALTIDGEEVGRADLPLLMRIMSSTGPSIGTDHGSAVSDRYRAPFAFTGELRELVVQLSPERFADAEAATAGAEMSRQ
jgi:arylsulfatase A-like enzyme